MSPVEEARPEARKQVKKSTRKRSSSLGASPVLRGLARKRERDRESEGQDQPVEQEPAKKMSRASKPAAQAGGAGGAGGEVAALVGVVNQLKASIDSLREDMPTREDLSRVESNIKMHVDKNTKDIEKLFNLRREDKAQFKTRDMQVVGDRGGIGHKNDEQYYCLLYTSPSPRDRQKSRMPSSA